jgi:hypothetical protein
MHHPCTKQHHAVSFAPLHHLTSRLFQSMHRRDNTCKPKPISSKYSRFYTLALDNSFPLPIPLFSHSTRTQTPSPSSPSSYSHPNPQHHLLFIPALTCRLHPTSLRLTSTHPMTRTLPPVWWERRRFGFFYPVAYASWGYNATTTSTSIIFIYASTVASRR